MAITRGDFIDTLQIAETRCASESIDRDVAIETRCIMRALSEFGNFAKVSIQGEGEGEVLTLAFRYDAGDETKTEQDTRETLSGLATEQEVTEQFLKWGGAVGIMQWLIEHDKGCVALLESQGYATYYERREWIRDRLKKVRVTVSQEGESHES